MLPLPHAGIRVRGEAVGETVGKEKGRGVTWAESGQKTSTRAEQFCATPWRLREPG